MKNYLKILASAVLCVSVVAFTASCVTEEEQSYEVTKLTVSSCPENVSRVRLIPDSSKWSLSLYEAKTSMASEYFSGNATLIIDYNRLSDEEYDEYFGYGIRSDSASPFKVFINGVEAENEAPAATDYIGWDEVEVNATTGEFRTSFNITGVKTLEVTFENAPEKIKNKDIRLADETIYAYIDTSALEQNFKNIAVWDYDENTTLDRLGRNGLYVIQKYTPNFYISVYPKDEYYISAGDFETDAGTDVSSGYAGETYYYVKFEFTSSGSPYVDAGTVISVTGGTVTAYDVSAFAGKKMVFSENSQGGLELTSAALEINETAGERTFALTIDGSDYTGTWKAGPLGYDEYPCIYLTEEGGRKFELWYYENGLNNTPGPCWHFEETKSGTRYFFVFKEASE